ncbi:MAG: hypothetical protein ACOCUS_02385, partial [Polyangiales bacterium]
RRADLVITSPPYGGTYDYVAHHARRFPWLGLDPQPLERGEIGARRQLRGKQAERRWTDQLRAVLDALAAARSEGALVVLLLGDAQLGKARIEADAHLRRLTEDHALSVAAVASQRRPDWTGHHPRDEHLIALR